MKKSKINYDPDLLHRLRKQAAFDFLTVNRDDLTPDQQATVSKLFKHNREDRGLTEEELRVLFGLVDSLKPDDTVIIRGNK